MTQIHHVVPGTVAPIPHQNSVIIGVIVILRIYLAVELLNPPHQNLHLGRFVVVPAIPVAHTMVVGNIVVAVPPPLLLSPLVPARPVVIMSVLAVTSASRSQLMLVVITQLAGLREIRAVVVGAPLEIQHHPQVVDLRVVVVDPQVVVAVEFKDIK